ncbi:MAG: hypothetical protein IJY37_02115, partial [Clostridia bacterium]|nr:hypothetical protein [Clostridia bacterium]
MDSLAIMGIKPQIGDPEKFCVKVNKYFQSDETQSMRTNLKGSIFYGKSIERNVERVCEQP